VDALNRDLHVVPHWLRPSGTSQVFSTIWTGCSKARLTRRYPIGSD